MKKYLICGALALMTGLVVTSCTHDEDLYENVDSVEKKTEDFRKAFKQAFGTIASNQDWGFDRTVEYEETPTAATTRGAATAKTGQVVKKDMGEFPLATEPNSITTSERSYVTKWFQENPGLTECGPDIHNFYIQYVSGDVDNKKGMWHRYDQNRINNGYNSNYWDEEFTDNGGMDYLEVGDGTNMEHVLDFNAKSGGPWGVVYIKNGSAKYWQYQSTWATSDKTQRLFKFAKIDVPGVGVGYYVGLSLYGYKYDNGDKELGIQRIDYAEDWILKISPGEGETIIWENDGEEQPEDQIEYRYEYTYDTTVGQSTKRIFCEDLGSSYSSRADFDYNDAVFDATLFERRYKMLTYTVHYQTLRGVEVDGSRYEDATPETTWDVIKPDGAEDGQTQEQRPRYFAKIDLYAAGGTIPLKIFDEEIHEAFGVGETTMVNTFDSNSENHTITDEKSGKTISAFGSHTYIKPPVRLKNTYTAKPAAIVSGEASDTNYPLDYLFELAPDTLDGKLVKPDLIKIPVYTRFASSGVTILQSDRGDAPHKIAVPTNTRWTSERCDIADAYADFSSYVSGQSDPWSSGNDDYLYDEERSVSNYVKGQTSSTTYSEGSDTEQAYYVNDNGFDVSQGLYLTGTNILSGLAEGDRIRVHVKDVQSGYILILSSGDAARINVDQSQVAGKDSGFIDFGLTAAMISKLTSGNDNANLILSGSGLKVTRIGVVRKK